MNCPTYQAALPEDAAFCGHCGGALRRERKCARCGKSNSPEMRFCLGCGAALSITAPPQAPRAYTPKHLAEKILTSRTALDGECKQVTILFADVKGPMDLAEQVEMPR
jgi:Double zinc ribbon